VIDANAENDISLLLDQDMVRIHTTICELYLLNQEGQSDQQLQATVFKKYFDDPLVRWAVRVQMTPNSFGYESFRAFSDVLDDIQYALNSVWNGWHADRESCRMWADTFFACWSRFAADLSQIELELRDRQIMYKAQIEKQSAAKGGRLGKGRPKKLTRAEVVRAFKTNQGDRSLKQFLIDWVGPPQMSYSEVECALEDSEKYVFMTVKGEWSAKIKTLEVVAKKARTKPENLKTSK
jgi:hypothetical protein